jgi:hypothetical protein
MLQGTCVRGLTKIAVCYRQTTVVVWPARDDELDTMKCTRFLYEASNRSRVLP